MCTNDEKSYIIGPRMGLILLSNRLVFDLHQDLLSIYIPCISILFVLLHQKTSSAKIRMRITSVSENRTPPTTPTAMTTTGTAAAAELSLPVLIVLVVAIISTGTSAVSKIIH